MTNKKSSAPKSIAASPPQKLDAATLSNMAHHSSPIAASEPDNEALQPIIEMLEQLSPSKLHLVENILRVIVDEQTRDRD